jgi:hypothetical protein
MPESHRVPSLLTLVHELPNGRAVWANALDAFLAEYHSLQLPLVFDLHPQSRSSHILRAVSSPDSFGS